MDHNTGSGSEHPDEAGAGDAESSLESGSSITVDLEDARYNCVQIGTINEANLQLPTGGTTTVNITNNFPTSSTPSSPSAKHNLLTGDIVIKITINPPTVDQATRSAVFRNQSPIREHLRGMGIPPNVDIRVGCIELVFENPTSDTILKIGRSFQSGAFTMMLLDILSLREVIKHLTSDTRIDIRVEVYLPKGQRRLFVTLLKKQRLSVESVTHDVQPARETGDDDQTNPKAIVTSEPSRENIDISQNLPPNLTPRLHEEDTGLYFLFRQIHRRFSRDRLMKLQTSCRKILGEDYAGGDHLITSTLDLLHQLSLRGHLTRHNVTLLWCLLAEQEEMELLNAVVDFEESVEAQVKAWLHQPHVWDNCGFIACGLSRRQGWISEKFIQSLVKVVEGTTGTEPYFVHVRVRSIGGPLSVTMILPRKVQEVDRRSDLKEELRKLGIEIIDIGSDTSKVTTHREFEVSVERKWWVINTQEQLKRSYREWGLVRAQFSPEYNINVLVAGVSGVGKSSCINSFATAVSGQGYREYTLAGWYGGTVEPLTMSTQRIINCGVTGGPAVFPNLIDTMGFPDENRDHLKEVLRLYIHGYIGTEVPTPYLMELANTHGWSALREQYNTYHPEWDVDRIIYVISARQVAPENNMAVVRECAGVRPIYLIITKTDLVEDEDVRSLRATAQKILEVEDDHVFTMINYSDDTTPDRITQLYPALDAANIKLLAQICRPMTLYET